MAPHLGSWQEIQRRDLAKSLNLASQGLSHSHVALSTVREAGGSSVWVSGVPAGRSGLDPCDRAPSPVVTQLLMLAVFKWENITQIESCNRPCCFLPCRDMNSFWWWLRIFNYFSQAFKLSCCLDVSLDLLSELIFSYKIIWDGMFSTLDMSFRILNILLVTCVMGILLKYGQINLCFSLILQNMEISRAT